MTQVVSRRALLQAVFAGAGATLLGAGAAQSAVPRVITLVAKRFVYEPNEIELKVGERVVVAIQSVDFVHGMNIPDLNKRLDLVPGTVTKLELNPQAPGEIEFVCDNFCGDGHEQMHGRFVVKA